MADNKPAADVQQLPEIIIFGLPSFFESYEKEFNSRFRVLKAWESPVPLAEFLEGRAQNTRAAVCGTSASLSAAVLSILPSLRLIVASSAGLNHIDLTECRRRGIAVTYAASLFSGDAADFAVGLLLDVLRKISSGNRFVKNGFWADRGAYPLGFKLGGKRVGIVGLGNIGLEVAKRLEAFGCEISYLSRKKKSCVSYVFYKSIHDLAANSDILAICCALTEETRHMINRDVMLALGRDGVIVNIARGGVIDEKELVGCLQAAEIGGAGLDVFEHEPLLSNELLQLDNVVLSPHAAVLTQESMDDLFHLMVANLQAFFSNKPLITPVYLNDDE